MIDQKKSIERVATAPPDLTFDALETIRVMLPSVFTDGRIDFDKLRAALESDVEPGPEKYALTWAGRSAAIRLLRQPARSTLVPELDLSIDFDTTENIFIEGENLEVLKLLHKPYFGQVKMIYLDPPYNTGNEFIYWDDYADPLDACLRLTGQKDESGNLLTTNPETAGRRHSSWLSMMYPRLYLAQRLLSDDGVIFVSIDDNEVHNLRLLMDQIVGAENFIGQIAVQLNPRGRHLDKFLARTHEYVVVYARDATEQPIFGMAKDERMRKEYNKSDDRGDYRELELRNRNPAFNKRTRPNLYYPIYVDPETLSTSLERDEHHGVEVFPKNSKGEDSCWTWRKEKFRANHDLIVASQTAYGSWRIFRKDYLIRDDGEAATTMPKSLWLDKEINNDYGKKAIQELFDGQNLFDFPKAPELIKKMIRIGTQKGDIVLDFFAGSCTTAQALLEVNREDDGHRQFICVQLPEPTPAGSLARAAGYDNIAQLGSKRIRRVIQHMADEERDALPLRDEIAQEDLGFRYFRMQPSNFREWEPANFTEATASDGATYLEQLEVFSDPLNEGWTPVSVICETMLREGYSLTSVVSPVAGTTLSKLWKVSDEQADRTFVICLDDDVSLEALTPLGLSVDDVLICRDQALDDTTAANLALQCRLKLI